ncbi:MAG TPA: hypothetical protein VLJ15_02805 [Gammaproteobacteria bacterium]|nr:hypothetical protein [Gammaproteobacteria bacterium]
MTENEDVTLSFLEEDDQETLKTHYHALISAAFSLKNQQLCYDYFNEACEKKMLTPAICETILQVMTVHKDKKNLSLLYPFIKESRLDTPTVTLRAIYAYLACGEAEAALSVYFYSPAVATHLNPTKVVTEDTDNIHLSILLLILKYLQSPDKIKLPLDHIQRIVARADERLRASGAPFNRDNNNALMQEIADAYPVSQKEPSQTEPVVLHNVHQTKPEPICRAASDPLKRVPLSGQNGLFMQRQSVSAGTPVPPPISSSRPVCTPGGKRK